MENQNLLCFVASSTKNYYVYGLDIRGATDDLTEGPVHTLPNPIQTLPIAAFSQPGVGVGYPFEMSFGSIGSTLYMIGGSTFTPSTPHIRVPCLDVYMVDICRPPPHNVTKGPLLRSHKGENPIVISLSDKLYIFPRSLDPESEEPTLIEFLDPEISSWSVIPLPLGLVELANRPFKVLRYNKVVTIDRCDLSKYNPYVVEGYGTRGSEILFSLSMCKRLGCGDIVFNVETHEWCLPDQGLLSMLHYPSCLFSDGTCCAMESTGSYVHLLDIDSKASSTIPISSPVPMDETRVVKYGERRLLTFSWTKKMNEIECLVGTYFRVDVIAICRKLITSKKKRLRKRVRKDVKSGAFVKAIIYEEKNPRSKLVQVHYCYLLTPGNFS